MKKLALSLAAVAAVSLASPAFAADHKVKMLDNGADGMMVFEPGYVNAAPGDTVTFVPVGSAHNSASAYVPEGAEPWNGAPNEEITVKLDTEGVYLYNCTPHLALGMVGVIQVGKAGNLAAAQKAAAALKGKIGMGAERVDKYMGEVE
ncbi:MAG: pseudoazurin [Ectothiorhodospiraceae bacterium]|jgi:pseudoazurin